MNDITYAANTTLTQTTNPVVTFNFEPVEKYGIALYNKTTGQYKSNLQESDFEQIVQLQNTTGMSSTQITSALNNALDKVNVYLYKTSDDRVLGIQIDPTDDIGEFQNITTTFKYNEQGISMKINCGNIPDVYNLYMICDAGALQNNNTLNYRTYAEMNSTLNSLGVSNSYNPVSAGRCFGIYNSKLYDISTNQLSNTVQSDWRELSSYNKVKGKSTASISEIQERVGWLLSTDVADASTYKDVNFSQVSGSGCLVYFVIDTSDNYNSGWS